MGERGGFSDICKYLALEYLKILAINLVILLKNIKKNGDPECSYNGAVSVSAVLASLRFVTC